MLWPRDWFIPNFFLLVALGVGVLYWLGYHTEWLGVVGGILGLGGAFAWAAFVLGVVRSERKAAMQVALDRAMASPWATLFTLLAAAVFLLIGSGYGSVELDAGRDQSDRYVEIYAHGTNDRYLLYADVLPARSTRKFLLRAREGRSRYTLRVVGLPELEVEARPMRRRVVRSPDAMLARNVVLLRPSTEVSQTALRDPEAFVLSVSIGDGPFVQISPFRGQTVWIGCDDSVLIPPWVRDRWRLELAAARMPEAHMLPWMSPAAVPFGRELRPGESVEARVHLRGQEPWAGRRAVVEDCGRAECFPQEVIVDAL